MGVDDILEAVGRISVMIAAFRRSLSLAATGKQEPGQNSVGAPQAIFLKLTSPQSLNSKVETIQASRRRTNLESLDASLTCWFFRPNISAQ